MSYSSVILPIVNFVMAASLHRVRLRRIRSARQRSSSTLAQKPSTWRDCGSALPSAMPTPSRRLRRIELTWVKALIRDEGLVVTPGVAFGDAGRGFFRISLVREAEILSRAAEAIARRTFANALLSN